ncbi:hypothetical protein QYF36_025097 [Acer negundo]|nr:hypothetical protein QYF36_025097 [Acer negundo]
MGSRIFVHFRHGVIIVYAVIQFTGRSSKGESYLEEYTLTWDCKDILCDETATMLEIIVPKNRIGPEEHEVRVCSRPFVDLKESYI